MGQGTQHQAGSSHLENQPARAFVLLYLFKRVGEIRSQIFQVFNAYR